LIGYCWDALSNPSRGSHVTICAGSRGFYFSDQLHESTWNGIPYQHVLYDQVLASTCDEHAGFEIVVGTADRERICFLPKLKVMKSNRFIDWH
jgi:hypothetical protein